MDRLEDAGEHIDGDDIIWRLTYVEDEATEAQLDYNKGFKDAVTERMKGQD